MKVQFQSCIKLDNQLKDIYNPGEEISGKVVLVNSEEDISGIEVSLIGIAFLRKIAEGPSSPDTSPLCTNGYAKTLEIVNKQQQIFACKTVFTDSNTSNREYSFSLKLPGNVPSSFKGPYGSIRYRIEVTSIFTQQHEWVPRKVGSVCRFQVEGRLDLNALDGHDQAHKSLQVPVDKTWVQYYNGMEIKFHLNHRAFIPGEEIRFSASVDFHPDSNSAPQLRVSLVQEQVYKMEGKSLRHGVPEGEAVSSQMVRDTLHWNGALRIPDGLPPTNFWGGCSLLGLHYFLKVSLDMGPNEVPLTHKVPLIIGTIPFKNLETSEKAFARMVLNHISHHQENAVSHLPRYSI